ncbi:unnamed protein product, partial [Laminaria digitata]
PYDVPPPRKWAERLQSVLLVLYLIFTRGYDGATSQAPSRGRDLCEEAIGLTALVARLIPQEPEILGLLAMMILHDARRDARTNSEGQFVPLERQDRSAWDHAAIERGSAILGRALARRRPGPYQIQAAISALHCEASLYEETDWPQIAALYHELYMMQPTETVALNRVVAVSFAFGYPPAMALLEPLLEQRSLIDYAPFHAVHAHVLMGLGKLALAREAFERAAQLTEPSPERDHLLERARACIH